jgi:two-component system, OmpR family, sensor kinase
MRAPRALQTRLGLAIGVLVALLWLGGALFTIDALRREMDEVFDAALKQTAERILPFAIGDVLDRESDDRVQIVNSGEAGDERYSYILRNAEGRVLIQSQTADPAAFPAFAGEGFSQTKALRIYSQAALRGTLTISLGEPLEHRRLLGRELQMGMILPLLLVIPLALLGIALVVRQSFLPLRQFRRALAGRGARDLSALELGALPAEIQPMGGAINALLKRLNAAFEAERSFAANAAHELRTPLAGAIAQAQRLQVETADTHARQRALDIEVTLKRLVRLAERLMQLARAEGGRLRLEGQSDLRPVLSLMVEDARRRGALIETELPEVSVMSDIDPDLFGILCRNLLENAERHGTQGLPIKVLLSAEAGLRVRNDCAAVPAAQLADLTARFARADGAGEGSGIGLPIVQTIAERCDGGLVLRSPIPGAERGFEAEVRLRREA